ncbi:MAG: SMC-Scp complex subunit ScpB [Nitrososphaeria archaeon]
MSEEQDISFLKGKIEAALYVAGRPLSLEEISKATGIRSKRKNLLLAREVLSTYNSFSNALEILELPGNLFVLQLKQKYRDVVKKFSTKPLLPESALRTLSYIAFYQPVTVKDVVNRIGVKAYRHISMLEALDFVMAKPGVKPKTYVTTPNFSRYFGLSEDISVLKEQLKNRVGRGLKL